MDGLMDDMAASAKLRDIGQQLTGRDNKRRRMSAPLMSQEEENRLRQDLAAFIESKTHGVTLNENQTLELEVRFGQFMRNNNQRGSPTTTYSSTDNSHGFRFEAEVAKEDYINIAKSLGGRKSVERKQQTLTSYIYPGKMRVNYDADRQEVVSAENKNVIAQLNLFLPRCKYDMRVGLAIETSDFVPGTVPPGFEKARKKERVSMIEKNPSDPLSGLRFDMTKVSDMEAGPGGDMRQLNNSWYEVELEYCASTPIADVPSDQLAGCMWGAIAPFIKREEGSSMNMAANNGPDEHSAVPYIHTEVVRSHELIDFLKNTTLRLAGMDPVFNPAAKNQKFMGTLPVAFRRAHIPLVQGSIAYFVSEKTDGVRFFLLSTQGKTYFVDRKFTFHEVIGFNSLYGALKESLIDGEVVLNRQTNKPYFMVFDILGIQTKTVVTENLEKRLHHIQKVVGEYRNAIADGSIPPEHPFQVIGKTFFKLPSIGSVTNMIEDAGSYRLYNDRRVRCHKTDGIIITADKPYAFNTAFTDCMKWKFPDKITIDVRVYSNKEYTTTCFCGGQGNTEINITKMVEFQKEDQQRLCQEMEVSGMTNAIAEIGYHPESGKWRFHVLRPDKDRPNFIDTVFDSLLQLADNISMEELRYRLARDQMVDDWALQLASISKIGLKK